MRFCIARADASKQPLEGPVDRATDSGLLVSLPCSTVRLRCLSVAPALLTPSCSQALIPPTAHQTVYHAQEAPENMLECVAHLLACTCLLCALTRVLSCRLDHIYGYSGSLSRHNLLYASDGRLLYPAGAALVVYDANTHEQSFLVGRGAVADVLCVALHPDGDLVATGCAGEEAVVCVWSVLTGRLRAELHGFHARAVTALAFDPTGELLASAGLDEQHSVALYDWGSARLVASAPGGGRAFVAGFSALNGALVTGGVDHLTFWTAAGASLMPTEADYDVWRPPGVSAITVTALGFHPDGGALTGSATGTLYRWEPGGSACLWSCNGAHAGPLLDIAFTGDVLATGGKDGRIVIWAPAEMHRVQTIDLRDVVAAELDVTGRPTGGTPGRAPAVRSLCADLQGARLLVGTASGEAWEIDITQSGSWRAGCQMLFAAHGPGARCFNNAPPISPRACGLATHPCELAFATAGEDATLRLWDCVDRACTLRRPLPAPGVSVTYSPEDGRLVACGLADGRLLVLDSVSGAQHAVAAHRTAPLCVLTFSPDGRWLAAGCDDGCIDMCACMRAAVVPNGRSNALPLSHLSFDATFGFHRVGSCVGHETPVEHADWSADCRFLQSNGSDGALLFWELPACELVRHSSLS